MSTNLSRRSFLTLASGAAAASIASPAFALSHHHSHSIHKIHHKLHAQPHVTERKINMINVHTNEHMSLIYWRQGKYLPHAMRQVAHVMRDHRNNKTHHMDPKLMDLLHDLQRNLDTEEPFHLISGYRSPQTNAWLHRMSGGVAVKSMHLKGQAADIVLPGVSLERLHNCALEMGRGGVGYYPRSDFVHVDTGKVREWAYE